MMFRRRQLIRWAAGAAALPFASCLAGADGYPSRAVRVLVGLPAGNSPDIVARITIAEFTAYIAAETEKWGKVVQFAHVTAE